MHHRPATTALQALTSAALMLPGLVHTAEPGQALTFQYSRYEEGDRDLGNVFSGLQPLRVETLRASAYLQDGNGLRLDANISQDSWSGATPVATSLQAATPNRPVLRNTVGGVVASGASPYVNTQIALDSNLQPVVANAVNNSKVLVMSSASPEIRKQADFAVARDNGAGSITARLGISDEPDYRSLTWGLGASLADEQQLNTFTAGFSRTTNDIEGLLDEDLLPYLARHAYSDNLARSGSSEKLVAGSDENALALGFTRVLNQASWLDISLGYSEQKGYLANPYKAVTVVFADAASRRGDVRALMEQRPESRYQQSVAMHYALSVDAVDAALHVDYQYADDSWQLDSHSVDFSWIQNYGAWQLAPHLRYYTQGAAGFYQPVLFSTQAFRRRLTAANGLEIWRQVGSTAPDYLRTVEGNFLDAAGNDVDPAVLDLQPVLQDYDATLLPGSFSGDHRLAGFGSISGGLTVSREFAAGFRVEASWDYYRRRSGWQLHQDEDSSFADYAFTQFNIGIRMDLDSANRRQRRESSRMQMGMMDHEHDMMAGMSSLPAGLMFAHAPGPGSFMSVYHTRYQRMAGSILQGDRQVSDTRIVQQGCPGTDGCRLVPQHMTMQMHMVSLMMGIAPGFSLMIMPQFMSMDMQLRELAGRPPIAPGVHEHGVDGHRSSTLGDTVVAATWGPFGVGSLTFQATLGISIPTGRTDLEFRRVFRNDGGLLHFGMQTGSGTWDLLPALTVMSTGQKWQYGAQLNATGRMQDANDSGYRLGNEWQVSAWLTRAISGNADLTARLTHTNRARIGGDYNRFNGRIGPVDFPFNQGGEITGLGLGFNLMLPGSSMLGFEWQLPLLQHVNGMQLEQDHSLSAQWSYGF